MESILIYLGHSYVIFSLAVVGFILSLYSAYLEKRLAANKQYQPVCDISNKFSCTRSILSPYGKLWGTSAALWGMQYYSLLLALIAINVADVEFVFFGVTISLLFLYSSIGLIVSVYFAYLLFFKIRTVCLVCLGVYIVNIALVACSAARLYAM